MRLELSGLSAIVLCDFLDAHIPLWTSNQRAQVRRLPRQNRRPPLLNNDAVSSWNTRAHCARHDSAPAARPAML
ncbi:hypothetical protein VTO73DRAFT_15579 [Trametes versicolor]